MSGLRAKHKGGPRSAASSRRRRRFSAKPAMKAPRSRRSPAQAEVSVGTIYNYYQNKGDHPRSPSSRWRSTRCSMPGAASSPSRRANVGEARRHADRHLYRAFAASISARRCGARRWRSRRSSPTARSARPTPALDRALTDQICALIARLQELGLVRRRHRRAARSANGLQQHEHDVHRVREARRGEDRRTARRDTKAEPGACRCRLGLSGPDISASGAPAQPASRRAAANDELGSASRIHARIFH